MLETLWGLPLWQQLALALAMAPVLALGAMWLRAHVLSPNTWLPGPRWDSIVFGHLVEMLTNPRDCSLAFRAQHGSFVRAGAFYGDDRLMVFDTLALQHILLSRAYDYPKPNEARGELLQILGNGVLFAEGDDHKRQRRILNPSFSPSHLRDILPTFFECVYRLRDAWDETLAKREHESLAFRDARHRAAYDDDGKSTVIEVYHWASRVTLDIIGSAGFGHEFGATVGKQNKLEQATRVMFGGHHGKPTPVKLALIRLTRQLFDWVPIIKFIPNKRVQEVRLGAAAFEQESRRILAAKKRDEADADKSGAITDDTFKRRKDLMALLLKSTRHDARMQLSDSELRGQMTTFLLAGHETTSTLLTWTLHRLSTRPDVQSRLRDEIRGARDQIARDGRGEFEADELNALPYLDAVTREVSRLDPPVSMTVRESAVDDVIPLSAPIRARDGSTHDAVPIKKGQIILIPIAAYNRDTAIFGDDANEFRPERWLESTKVADGQHTVGVWSPLLTFLAGPRSCIGYRFAILELKALLSALIEQYEFAPRDAAMVINARANIVIRPVIDGEDDLGYRLPLRVTRVDAA